MLVKNHFANVKWFDPDDGGGNAAPPELKADAKADNKADGEKKFSQADMDKVVGERAKRAGESAVNALLESFGVKSPDEIKAALEQLKKLDEASKSELDKQKAESEKWKAAAEKEKTKAAEILQTANERLLKSAVLLEAQKQNIDDGEIASVWLVLANDKTLREKITQNENGDSSTMFGTGFENVAEVVKEIAKQHPKWLKTQPTKTPGTPPARTQQNKGGGNGGASERPIFSSGEF